uniref:Uncharacterized protein n=1 Tax=Panagrolaimus sp. JU765 TaxID=591449 RepID=A0AC34RIS0_9BILA
MLKKNKLLKGFHLVKLMSIQNLIHLGKWLNNLHNIHDNIFNEFCTGYHPIILMMTEYNSQECSEDAYFRLPEVLG